MTQIVESLFGVSPERYQQQKDAALQQEALAYAQLDPLQRATAGIYAGARQFGSGIGRMLGGEDPGMRRVTEQDQIIRSIDLNNPETFGPAAQRAYQMGHTELAQKIMLGADTAYQRQEAARQRAAQMQSRQQTQAAQQLIPRLMTPGQQSQMMVDAEGGSYMQEGQAAGIDQNTLRQLMATPAGRAELADYLKLQEATRGKRTTIAEGGTVIEEDPFTGAVRIVATGANKPVVPPSFGSEFARTAAGMFPGVSQSALTGPQIEAVNKRIEAEKKSTASAGAAKLTVQDKRNDLSLRELDIPRAKEFSESAASARRFAADAEVIANLLRGKGGGTLVKVAADVARSFGLKSDTITANDLANSLSTRGAVAIRAPGSGSTSDIEFKAYLEAFPSLSNSEPGRDLMAKYAKEFSKRSSLLADHARKLIRDDKYSEEEIARYDESLGKVLTDEFYNFSKSPKRNPSSSAPSLNDIITPLPAPTAAPAVVAPTAVSTPVRAPAPAPIQAPAPAPIPTPARVIPPIDAGLTAPATLFRPPAAKSAGGNRVTIPSTRQETAIYNSLDANRSANGDVDVKRGNKRVIIGNTNDDVSAVELVYEYIRKNNLATKGK